MVNKKNLHLLILAAILLVGFLMRLYRFDSPIADWHSWRQADTSAVSRNFVEHGYDVLHPRFDDLSNIASGKDNPEGYRFVEFPIYNIAQAGLFQLFGILTLEEWGRLVTILSSVLSVLFLYLIVSRHSNKTIGLFAAFFQAFIPYNIYYGRTILPDTSMMMAVLGGIYFFDLYVNVRHPGKRGASASRISNVGHQRDSGHLPANALPALSNAASSGEHRQLQAGARMTIKNYLFFVFSILFTAGAFLLKPYAVFFVLPMVVLAYQRWGFKLLLRWELWFFAIVSVGPLVWWRHWMTQFPEGIPANAWLLNGNGIRFRPSFFRWIGYERIVKLISGYLGSVLLVLSFFQLKKMKEWAFFTSFLVGSALYVCVFATGNVQHDYYQILIMPTISLFCALGSYFLWSSKSPLGKIVLTVCLIGMFYFTWDQVKDYFNINNRSIVVAGEAVDRLIPKDAKIIANYTGDTSFLYQTKRKGWASFEKDLPEMVKMGASYLVLVNPTEQDLGLGKTYKIISQMKEYVLFDLKSKL